MSKQAFDAPGARCWIAVGDRANWETGLDSGQIWGLIPKHRGAWERMQPGDLLLMYVKAPVKGVVGAGMIRGKFKQTAPLWKEEVAKDEVIWELRFEFDVTMLLPVDHWEGLAVPAREHGLPIMAGISSLAPEKAMAVVQALQQRTLLAQVGYETGEEADVAVAESTTPLPFDRPPPPPPPTLSVHSEIQQLLCHIGQIQRYFPEPEYSFEGGRLDVIWRRVIRSVPTYAFEVHISGNLESALGKLSMAHRLWNSRPFLVTEEPTRPKASYLLDNAFVDIGRQARILSVDQVRDLAEKKQAYFDLESEMGLA